MCVELLAEALINKGIKKKDDLFMVSEDSIKDKLTESSL